MGQPICQSLLVTKSNRATERKSRAFAGGQRKKNSGTPQRPKEKDRCQQSAAQVGRTGVRAGGSYLCPTNLNVRKKKHNKNNLDQEGVIKAKKVLQLEPLA